MHTTTITESNIMYSWSWCLW